MEYYESRCSSCGHVWQWTGYKTSMGKTSQQLEAMKTMGKTCPSCGSSAEVGLDHTSDRARSFDSALKDAIARYVLLVEGKLK